jgi:hypothetical protein
MRDIRVNQMTQEITPEWMRSQIDDSNMGAAANRNLYPIQEQATQQEIWEYVPCTCDNDCTCMKLGCTHHWKLKKGVGFREFRDGFLRMFAGKNLHRAVIDALDGRGTDNLTTRSIWAYHVLKNLQINWPEISNAAAGHNKILFCDDWLPESLRERMSFPVEGTSIYHAKQYSVLFPDVCVPYDTASRAKMLGHFGLSGASYIGFLTIVRNRFLDCMKKHGLTIPALRRLDNPEARVLFDPAQVSLPCPGMNYGTAYSPPERTISLVLDKCFYNPKAQAAGAGRTKNIRGVKDDRPAENPGAGAAYVTRPLSGNGQDIAVYKNPSSRRIQWGKMKFDLSDAMIRTILDGFFTETGQWYKLGASMTDPDPAGLGAFIRKSFPSFTPRHASAVAAIMEHEGFVVSRGKKPIELRMVASRF